MKTFIVNSFRNILIKFWDAAAKGDLEKLKALWKKNPDPAILEKEFEAMGSLGKFRY